MITRKKIDEIYRNILKGLDPSFAARVAAWRDAVIASGVIPYIYCGARTPAEQEELYRQGRTKSGKIVTNARGYPIPQSFHCYGRAIDWVPAKKIANDSYEADWVNVQHRERQIILIGRPVVGKTPPSGRALQGLEGSGCKYGHIPIGGAGHIQGNPREKDC